MPLSKDQPLDPLLLEQQLSYSLRRQYVDEYLAREIKRHKEHEFLLDIGGVKEEKRGKFDVSRSGMQTWGLNISTAKGIDIQADAGRLPVRSHTFDWVLCSELLEHVENPLGVLREAFRVLKVSGSLVITVPFLFRLHTDPIDVARYTSWFWHRQLEEIGFTEIRVEKQGLFWSVMVDMMRDWLRYLVVSRRVKSRAVINLFPRIARYFRQKAIAFDTKPELQDHDFFGRYTGGFGIVASKP